MSDHYTIKLADGKYTIIHWQQGAGGRNGLEFLRHGEPWPGAGDLRYANVVVAMHQRIEELETAIRGVIDGTLLHNGSRFREETPRMIAAHGHRRSESIMLQWDDKLRNVLEQK